MSRRAWLTGCVAVVLGAFCAVICARAAEETVTLDQVPAAVKAAIEKKTVGGKIAKIEKDAYEGKTVYEVEYVKDGKELEAAFTADGKRVASDDDEKDDKKNDGEDKK
jgi:hypothetical protein